MNQTKDKEQGSKTHKMPTNKNKTFGKKSSPTKMTSRTKRAQKAKDEISRAHLDKNLQSLLGAKPMANQVGNHVFDECKVYEVEVQSENRAG